MMRTKFHITLAALFGLLLFPAGLSFAQTKYRIVSIYPSSSKVKINKVARGVDYVFSEKDVIDWEKGQEIATTNISNDRLCIFSEEAFSARDAKTVEQYIRHNHLSTRGEWAVKLGEKNQQAFPERRLALVIGIANYTDLHPLQNSINDARAVSQKLQSLGFDVMSGYDLQSIDGDKRDEFRDIVRKFYNRAESYDVALFYYAGHGLKHQQNDYLLPRDLSLKKEGSYGLSKKGISVLELVSMGRDSGVKDNIIVLDACRNESANWVRGDAIETGQIEPPENCCILYSTGSGKTAEDWSGYDDQNSPFTKAFLSSISTPGEKFVVTLENIKLRVINATASKQNPVYINRLSSDFIFNRSTPKNGAVSISSTPSGARIYIDGKDSGEKSNITIWGLTPGIHSIDLRLDGYNDYHASTQVNNGATSELSVTLEKKRIPTGSISVVSNPDGATVYIDGKRMNKVTPFRFDGYTVGKHTVRCEVIRAGKTHSLNQDVVVDNNKTSKLAFSFVIPSSNQASLKTKSQNGKVAVYLDGTKLGYSPDEFIVPTGKHTITFKKDGYNDESVNLEFEGEHTYTLEANLVKNPWKMFVKGIEDSFEYWQLGLHYSYTPHYSAGIGISGGYGIFDLGFDVSAGTPPNLGYIMQGDGKAWVPKWSWSVTPALKYKYVGLGLGLGTIYSYADPKLDYIFRFKDIDGKYFGIDDFANVTYRPDFNGDSYFTLNPTLFGYIPLPDGIEILLGIGYMLCPKQPERGGVSFKIGLRRNTAND